jgi:hypothetical protein
MMLGKLEVIVLKEVAIRFSSPICMARLSLLLVCCWKPPSLIARGLFCYYFISKNSLASTISPVDNLT